MRLAKPFERPEEEAPYVCHRCIGEAYIKSEIQRLGRIRHCKYCEGSRFRAVSIAWLSRRVDDIYLELVSFADEEPSWVDDSDNVHWQANGETPSHLISELIEAEDYSIAEDIVRQLGENHAFAIYKDGDTDWYDDTCEDYRISLPQDDHYGKAWQNFCQSLKHERRFFSTTAKKLLDEILGPILGGKASILTNAVRTIGPESDDRFIFRGRQANDELTKRVIYSAPIAQLGAPPPFLAAPGRMNPAGISVFYGSGDAVTCVAELRVPVGGAAVVGKFEIIRPVRLLDLTKLEKIRSSVSVFHPEFTRTHQYSLFIRGFHDEIKQPIIPGQENLGYLATQVVAEYLWTRSEGAVDGLIFGSSQLSGSCSNVVLFPHACVVEDFADELQREVISTWIDHCDPECPPEHATEHVTIGPINEDRRDRPRIAAGLNFFGEELSPVVPEPSLRLVTSDLRFLKVRAISYETLESAVAFRDHAEDVGRGEGDF